MQWRRGDDYREMQGANDNTRVGEGILYEPR